MPRSSMNGASNKEDLMQIITASMMVAGTTAGFAIASATAGDDFYRCPGDLFTNRQQPGCQAYELTNELSSVVEASPRSTYLTSPVIASPSAQPAVAPLVSAVVASGRSEMQQETCALYKE
ncbi:MAG: hypothetical protein C4293_09440, partial [Nitrospiraceae bacterium]